MSEIIQKLKGKDRRSLGRSDEVVHDVLNNPSLFPEVFEGMLHDDPIISMRCADALEKITKDHHEILQPYAHRLIEEASQIKQKEVQWHVAQMFSYLILDKEDKTAVKDILFGWIEKSGSNIVKVFSIQTLTEMAAHDSELKKKVVSKLNQFLESKIPSLENRAKKLIKKLNE
ncbi:hypothetical protein COV93_05005 [Candidatus Woesearchaeota archaeon CG11_big_fil_rev_8_21_14_0_20_43_8]|nr:MAG: hypothetical protein COV93_05005 [Candidatus Woesearchaeota archaeon CG11_big_fil_rev_8_21_14_0_20_43_8]PIO04628.1 MAG: hypothetical protein COT47_08190 [Candidatus Woesearchaeota archaeon CG08_land_8_20_14_0_20_43_7]